MCGIVAEFAKGGAPCDIVTLRGMAEEIHHRGPDDEGFLSDDWFGLGFKRLAILDPTPAGRQPMLDEGGRYVLVFNGEVYNFRDLRAELEQAGVAFVSNSDTEVVLRSLVRWGQGALARFVGMFALVFVDRRERRAVVARDPLGIKPLYRWEDDRRILLASEIKAFRNRVEFAVEEDALYEQFLYRHVEGKRTIFRGIQRVPAGHWLEIDPAGIRSESAYYDVGLALERTGSEEVGDDDVERALRDSIVRHTQSDVGYNLQLSGGVDSSYVAAVLREELGQELVTFSVSLEGTSLDEGPYQRAVASRLGTDHHTLRLGAVDLAEHLPRATWHMDLPHTHEGSVFLMLLCERSRAHSKVILTGEGADELFCGYRRCEVPPRRWLAFHLRRLGLRPWMIPPIGKFRTLRRLLGRRIGVDEQIFREPEAVLDLLAPTSPSIDVRERWAARYPDLLRRIVISDQTSYLATLLERQDKMAMAASVESRVPFCTHILFDLINRIPPSIRVRPNRKGILKRLARRYFDDGFVERKKCGLTLPLAEWLRDPGTLGGYLDLLTDASFRQRGYYDAASVARAVDEHLRGLVDRSWELMNLIRFEVWYRQFIAPATGPTTARTRSG